MTALQTRKLTRQQIGQFVTSERGIRAFEDVQADLTNQNDALSTGQFLTLTLDTALGSERTFAPVSGDLVGTDGGANANYSLGLAATAVSAGAYGANNKTVSFTVDAKGRLTAAAQFTLNTDNVTEGATNLFYTDARSRAALSAGSGISYNSATGVITNTGGGGGGGFSYVVTSQSTSYTETATSGCNVVKMTASGKTVTLPTAVGNTAMLTFKLMVAGTLTVAAAGAETIDGAATYGLNTQYQSVTIVSDNAVWIII